jgi:2-C-methyl-D-erythritol 4-phosphate cytidylyltransferase
MNQERSGNGDPAARAARAAQYIALIPAAGVGARMGGDCPKQYLMIAGKPMLRHTIDAFLDCDLIAHIFVVVSAADGYVDAVCAGAPDARLTLLRCGGATRQDSVQNGLQAIRPLLRDDDWVLVHDAARPGLHVGLIASLIAAVGDGPVGGLLALPVVDTVKRSQAGMLHTVARNDLWLAQTPQMFRYRLLSQALTHAQAGDGWSRITDDASAMEALDLCPILVPGHPCNLKVTLPSDIDIVTMYLSRRAG